MKIEIERGLVEHAIEALEAGPHASILMNTGGIAQSLRTALRKALAAPQPAKCWKCSEADPLFQGACNVPACGMREALAAPNSVEFDGIRTVAQQTPDALHLAAMDLARKQAQRIAELEAEAERFRQNALNEKAARQALEQQLAARVPLTDDELWSLWNSQGDDAMDKTAAAAFARTIEAAHGITKDPS